MITQKLAFNFTIQHPALLSKPEKNRKQPVALAVRLDQIAIKYYIKHEYACFIRISITEKRVEKATHSGVQLWTSEFPRVGYSDETY